MVQEGQTRVSGQALRPRDYREIWALSHKDISGESLAQEAAILITKWTARGLTEAVLQAVRADVFNVVAPVAP